MLAPSMMCEPLRSIVTVALQTGMRKEEVLSLRWSHVDLPKNLIFVAKPKWKGDKRKTKGIPMNSEVRGCLLELQAKARSCYIFAYSDGRRASPAGIHSTFKRACRQAEIEDFRFHDLRHTFGTRLGDAGGAPS